MLGCQPKELTNKILEGVLPKPGRENSATAFRVERRPAHGEVVVK